MNNENKEAKINSELTSISNNSSNLEIDNSEKNIKKSSRRKRGFEIRETELSALNNNDKDTEVKEIKNDKTENNNLSI